MRRMLFCLLASALSVSTSVAQANPETTSKDAKPKAKRVWTEEDIKKLKGPISVVGAPADSSPKSDKSKAADSKALPNQPEPANSEPQKEEGCVSDSWTAGVAAIANAQGVDFDAEFWSMRLFGGACLDSVRTQNVSTRITGDYALDSGAKIRIRAELFPVLPSPPAMVAAMQDNKPFLVSWKGSGYVVANVDYVDQVVVGAGGGEAHIYYPSRLTLANARTGRVVVFDVTRNQASEIEGSIQIEVTPRQ